MSSKLGIVGICGVSIGVVWINNVSSGKDPFPSMVAGGIFTAGCVGVGEIDADFGAAIAWVFLLANILTKSDPLLNFIGGVTNTAKVSKLNSTANSTHANSYNGMAGRNSTTNSVHASVYKGA